MRGNLDVARYGFDLGLPPELYSGRATSRFEQSDGQRKLTERVAGGKCVHHILLRTGEITRRGAVAIPSTWRAVLPTVQTSLFAGHHASDEFPTLAIDEALGAERDHIIHRRLHDAIAPYLSSEQAILVRRHWVVPSCREHNQERSQSLEPLSYLMHVFAIFLAAKNLTISDSVSETQMFVDVVKAAHVALRMQIASTDADARKA